MTTLKEMAADYGKESRYPSAQNTRRDAYLAGAKAALEMAQEECALVENNIDTEVLDSDDAWEMAAHECKTRVSKLLPTE